ncbi:hypothetical protein LBMAG41_13520 [Cyanobium sp.]|nr:hypothetical protein LBMAG41_13520 [Cyanobium sp.]
MPKPVDAEELIQRLEGLWPDIAPHPQATDREIQQQIGAVQVVRWLRAELLTNDDEAPRVYPPSFKTERD